MLKPEREKEINGKRDQLKTTLMCRIDSLTGFLTVAERLLQLLFLISVPLSRYGIHIAAFFGEYLPPLAKLVHTCVS